MIMWIWTKSDEIICGATSIAEQVHGWNSIHETLNAVPKKAERPNFIAWLKLDEKDNKLSRRVVFSFANSCISWPQVQFKISTAGRSQLQLCWCNLQQFHWVYSSFYLFEFLKMRTCAQVPCLHCWFPSPPKEKNRENTTATYGGFHKLGYPCSSSILIGFLQKKPASYRGTPMAMETPSDVPLAPVPLPSRSWIAGTEGYMPPKPGASLHLPGHQGDIGTSLLALNSWNYRYSNNLRL